MQTISVNQTHASYPRHLAQRQQLEHLLQLGIVWLQPVVFLLVGIGPVGRHFAPDGGVDEAAPLVSRE